MAWSSARVRVCIGLAMMMPALGGRAGQAVEVDSVPVVAEPTYASSSGPRVALDQAHHNFHTADGRYRPFAELLRRDGYRVVACNAAFSEATLRDIDVLVISNPLHASSVEDWKLPALSAFTEAEIEAVKHWVNFGGSMLLVLDHMPFPGAGDALARAFGFQFSNGFAVRRGQPPSMILFTTGDGLIESEVTRGRGQQDRVNQVASFTGSAFLAPEGAQPVLMFDERFESLEPARAWHFDTVTRSIALRGWCQGAIATCGCGRVAVFGEAAMFTSQVTSPGQLKVGMNTREGAENARLLLNIMRWLGRYRSGTTESGTGREDPAAHHKS